MTARTAFDIDRAMAGIRLGEEIRSRRTARSLTLRELATTLGVSAPYLCDVEKGRRGISADRLRQIARLLGTSVRRLSELSGVCGNCAGSGLAKAARGAS